MISCPNKNSTEWTELVSKYGEDKAYAIMNMPNPSITTTDYGYKIDDTLLIDVENLQVDSPLYNLIPLLLDIRDIVDYENLNISSHNNPFISDVKMSFIEDVIQNGNEELNTIFNVPSLDITIREWLENNDLDSLFKLNPNLTYIIDSDEITKTLLKNNVILEDNTLDTYSGVYDMFNQDEKVSFNKRKSEWLLDIIDNDTNQSNREIAKLLLKKMKYVYNTKVNTTDDDTYTDSINIKEANSDMFLHEFLSNMLSHIFDNNKLTKIENDFLLEVTSLYEAYNPDTSYSLEDIKSFVIDSLLNKKIQKDLNNISYEKNVENETSLYRAANKILTYEVNNKKTLLNATLNTILDYFKDDSLFSNIHKNTEFRKIQQQVGDLDLVRKLLKYMELNNITTYNDSIFKRYVQSLSIKEQKDVYLRLNSENRYSDKANLTAILKNLKDIYNKLSFSKIIERRLNGNVAKIIPNYKIDVTFNPESNTVIFNKNKYTMIVNNNIIYLNGKSTNNIQDLIDYLKSNFNMNVSFNGEVVEEIKTPLSDLDRRIREKIEEITKTPEEEIINQCDF